MTKEELILKWQKESDDWKTAYNDKALKYKTREMARNRFIQIQYCLEDIKNLNGETVKRQELINFLDYLAIIKNTHLDFLHSDLVDEYIKLINE